MHMYRRSEILVEDPFQPYIRFLVAICASSAQFLYTACILAMLSKNFF
jgi:hypothetical protein